MKEDIEEDLIPIEVNDKQGDFLEAIVFDLDAEGTKTAAMIGGIGSGKSVAMAAAMLLSKSELPRAKGQFACLTVTQFQRSILPGIKSVWREHFQLSEYNANTGEGDYIIGKKPPAGWEIPWQEPENWDNCIAFPNGWVMEVCGYLLNADIHRGRNDDFAFMDEALLYKREWLKILEGRIRANLGKYHSNLHWLICVFSSPPYGSTGDWMFDIEELQKEEPNRYFFMQVTTRDNAVFLPSNYIANLKKKLTKLEFDVEVLGKRLSKIPKAFYPSLSWERHAPFLEDYADGFERPDLPIVVSLDFNAYFTSCTVWQDHGREQRNIMDCFVKEPEPDMSMSESLAVELLTRLEHWKNKRIIVTGDRNGLSATAGSKKKTDGTWVTLYDEFQDVFLEKGWDVISSPLIYNPLKDEIYNLMGGILSERRDDGLHFRFHRERAKSTLISMQRTPITADYKKDKRSERKDDNQERATHLSDTVDYYAAWKCSGGATAGDSGFDIGFL